MNGASWTEAEQTELVAMAARGMTGREIGVAMGKTRNAVMGRCHRTGVILLPDARKRSLARPRRAAGPAKVPGRKFPPGHPVFKSHPWGGRAFTDAQIAIALAARFAGQSRSRSAALIGASAQSLKKWERKPDLVAIADVLLARAKADAAERSRAARELKAFAAEAERLHRERVNGPLLAAMPERSRRICEARIAGATLDAVGKAHGLTRERIRQIECKWRAQGLIIPSAAPLSAAAMSLFAPKPRRRPGRPRKLDFWAAAQTVGAPYRLSDEERQARADRMRAMLQRRREAKTLAGSANP